jgi:enoyl-[acyl-carrier protein] reductase / trans-2-enoyl-CoA reductase (NAD+)
VIIEPMIRKNICMNAHPVGCERNVAEQIAYVRSQPKIDGPKRVLIIGGSGGYGLATRIVAAYGCGAATVNVAYEKPAGGKRTATVGWYNTEAFEEHARQDNLTAKTLYADAFADETKARTAALIQDSMGQVDLIVYSLASGVRRDPADNTEYRSALKPIGNTYTERSVDPMTGAVSPVTMEPASEAEITATVKVMGGEDWELWIHHLLSRGVVAAGAVTVAYSYIGPEITQPIYRDGTIGKAKEHLEATAGALNRTLASVGGSAFVSVNKAVVTRASAVIPVVPLYFIILFRVMKEMGLHEGPIEQAYRLFHDRLYVGEAAVPTDSEGRIRLDDWEMRDDVQARVAGLWNKVDESNLHELTDFEGYRTEFLNIHGFAVPGVDYSAEVEP